MTYLDTPFVYEFETLKPLDITPQDMKDFIAGLDTTLVNGKEDVRTTFRGQRVWAKVGNQPVFPNPLLFFSSAKAAGLSRELWDLAFSLHCAESSAHSGSDKAIQHTADWNLQPGA